MIPLNELGPIAIRDMVIVATFSDPIIAPEELLLGDFFDELIARQADDDRRVGRLLETDPMNDDMTLLEMTMTHFGLFDTDTLQDLLDALDDEALSEEG